MSSNESIYIEISDSLFASLEQKLSQDFGNVAESEDNSEELAALRNLASTVAAYVEGKRKSLQYKKYNVPSISTEGVEEALEIATEYGINGQVNSTSYLSVTPKDIAFDEILKIFK